MKTIKLFVNQVGSALIVCPACGKEKEVPVAKFKETPKIAVKCSCGEKFRLVFNFRQKYRKQTDLEAYYVSNVDSVDDIVHSVNHLGQPNCKVDNLSMSGIGLVLAEGVAVPEVGDIVGVKFNLDDRRQSEVMQKVKVKIVRGQFVGGEFVDIGDFERNLGFYMMP